MKTIKINNLEVSVDELRRVIKENKKELMSAFLLEDFKGFLQEENKPFVERMIGKEYWMIYSYGRKVKIIWNNSELDNDLLSVNNIYWTESSCDKEIAKRKALGNIMSYIRDNEIELVKDEDWGNFEIDKFMISGWNYEDNIPDTDINDKVDWSKFSLAFYSQEDREKVIENCKEDLEILLKK